VCVLSATGFLDEVCARVKALSLFSLAIFLFSPHNSTHTHRESVVLYVVWAIDDAPGCRYIYTLGGGGGGGGGCPPTLLLQLLMELKRRINMGEREKEKMQREKNAEPSHGGLYTTRMGESESERERERLCSG
jgi:hypothetical protein